MKAIVTGGAGFIGSHIVDKLLKKNNSVIVLDNFRTGNTKNIAQNHDNKKFKLIKCDLTKQNSIPKLFDDCDIVFHFAANPEVRIGEKNTSVDFENNIIATRNVLEACRSNSRKLRFVFASTSAVYGEPSIFPTPESYAPLFPISIYSSSKLACEALVSGYCHMFDFKGYIFRFANVVGPRSGHGVIYDFLNKLYKNKKTLEILGDGSQSKSYLYVSDCVDAILHVIDRLDLRNSISSYNIGTMDKIDVLSIAKIVMSVVGLNNVKLKFHNSQKDGRGWKGDVKEMLLDNSKLRKLGWRPKYNSAEAIKRSTFLMYKNKIHEI